MDRIYLDNAATTPLHREVLERMLPWFLEGYGNASSVYATGREARKAVEGARRQVASALHCSAQEIYFTSGGTESDNWAIKGAALKNAGRGRHIVSTVIEHHAVLHTLQFLEEQGFEVTLVKADALGRVDPEAVRAAIRSDTILVSVMAANNEIGTLQPVRDIGRIAREMGVLFHTDAVQAVGAIPVDVADWQVDLLSLSAHKFHGPKGVGALYVRKDTALCPLMHGGTQERKRRAGTENVPAIVGLGAALQMATEKLSGNAAKVSALRDRLIDGILRAVPEARLTGDPENRLPNNASFVFGNIGGEALLLRLDLAGIAASSGSACTAGSLEPSHVLLATGLDREAARNSLRLTLSSLTTPGEIDEVLRVLPDLVSRIREQSGT